MQKVVLIPALEPDEKLIQLVDELRDKGLYRIILVDDGSGEEAQRVFDAAAARSTGTVVIRHDINMGKGAAIKTGLSAATDLYGWDIDVITCDADGQHRPDDIKRVAEAMDGHRGALVLGTRDFSLDCVPAKSRLGNRITSFFFRLTTGVKCADTQTGLRGVPAELLKLALKEDGSRYEYEMNFLQDAAAVAELVPIPIETVYEDNNRSSHFRPVRDSARVYGRLLRFACASLTGAASDYLLFLLLLPVLGTVFAATAAARIFSGMVNFVLNKRWSFKSRERTSAEAARYLVLFFSLMALSAGLVTALSRLIPAAIAKIVVDTALFFASYTIQRRWVFKTAGSKDEGPTEEEPMVEGSKMKGSDEKMNNTKATRRGFRWAPIYGTALVIYTVFTLIYTFVIPQNVVALDTAQAAEATVEENPNTTDTHADEAAYEEATDDGSLQDTIEPVITDSSYESGSLSISITERRVSDTDIYIADVILKNGNSLRSGLAGNSFGRNVNAKTSEIASSEGAVLAINGDYYGFRDTGYVMRNGYLYRNTSSGGEALVVYDDGSMEIVNENDVTAEELQSAGAVQIYSFGPGLIEDGEVSVSYGEEVAQSMHSNPRTAIGQISDDHYVFVVSDGRTSESAGLDLYDLALLMQDLGCENAYNLDGGGSSTMWFNGRVINNPTGGHAGHGQSERSVSDIIYVQ